MFPLSIPAGCASNIDIREDAGGGAKDSAGRIAAVVGRVLTLAGGG
jgi:hypothetical protein